MKKILLFLLFLLSFTISANAFVGVGSSPIFQYQNSPWFNHEPINGVNSSIWFDYENDQYAINQTPKSFLEAQDFTRNSTATYVNSTELIAAAAIDEPRLDYSTGMRGLLMEENRINLCKYGSDPANVGITRAGVTLVESETLSPDGTTFMARLSSTPGTIRIPLTTKSAGVTYATSVYMKLVSGSPTSVDLDIADGTSVNVVSQLSTGNIVRVNANIVAGGSGSWLDITVGGTADIDVWGYSVEAGTVTTSYMPTEDGSFSRAIDINSISGDDFSTTNVCLYGEDPFNAAITKFGSTLVDSTNPAPDGSGNTTATLTTTAASQGIGIPLETRTNGATYNVSMYAKLISGDATSMLVDISDGSSVEMFDQLIVGEFVRIDVPVVAGGSSLRLDIIFNDNVVIELYGYQVTLGSDLQDLILTAASSVTTYPWFNPDEGVFAITFERFDPDFDGNEIIISFNDGTNNNSMFIRFQGGVRTIRVGVNVGGSEEVSSYHVGAPQTWPLTVAFKYKSGDYAFSVNGEYKFDGTPLITSNASDVPVVNQLIFSDASMPFNGLNYNFMYYPFAPSNDDVRTLAARQTNIMTNGDSYVQGSNDIGVANSLGRLGYSVSNSALGGSTLEQATARVEEIPFTGTKPLIFCDGSVNGHGTVEQDIAKYDRIVTATSGNYVFISPIVYPTIVGGADETYTDSLTAEMLTEYGLSKVVDGTAIAEILAGTTNRSDAAYTALFQGDGVHPNQELSDAITQAALDLL